MPLGRDSAATTPDDLGPPQQGRVVHGVRLKVLPHAVGEGQAVDTVDGGAIHNGVRAQLV